MQSITLADSVGRHYLGLRKWSSTISVTTLPSPAAAGEGMGVRAELCQLSVISAKLNRALRHRLFRGLQAANDLLHRVGLHVAPKPLLFIRLRQRFGVAVRLGAADQ